MTVNLHLKAKSSGEALFQMIGANFGANFGAFWCKFWCILKMNGEDKIIAKLEEENEYLKSLLRMHNISFEKQKEIKQVGERHLI